MMDKDISGKTRAPHDGMMGAALQAVRQQTFYNTYWKTFSVREADSEALRLEAYRLRYQVYHGLEDDGSGNPDLIEKDEYDERATHHILYHKESGLAAGTVRVLTPSTSNPLKSFALQSVCDHPLLSIEERAQYLCEISRLCMAPQFRRRPEDGRILPAYYEQEWVKQGPNPLNMLRRRIPYAPLGLIGAAFDTAMRAGLLDCVSVMDPCDFASLKRIGFTYRVLGPRIEYQGSQQPIIFNIKHVLDNMAVQNRECWEIVSDHGKLNERANLLQQERWHDGIFDDVTRELSMRKLL